jgi:hypothetical protein
MKTLPLPAQIELAQKLGIDVSHDSVLIAAARILDVVAASIAPAAEAGVSASQPPSKPTAAQAKLARSIDLNIADDSSRVAAMRIRDRLEGLNRDAAKRLALVPGDCVTWSRTVRQEGKRLVLRDDGVVSSVGENGMVYLKGGNGRCCWARFLERSANPTRSSRRSTKRRAGLRLAR